MLLQMKHITQCVHTSPDTFQLTQIALPSLLKQLDLQQERGLLCIGKVRLRSEFPITDWRVRLFDELYTSINVVFYF